MGIDRSRYPPYWKQLSAYVRFDRAGGRCENCGATHGDPHLVTGKKVKLQCAHLNRTPERTRESELMALCARCHFAYDRADNQAKRVYGKNYKQQQLGIFEQNSPPSGEGGLSEFNINSDYASQGCKIR